MISDEEKKLINRFPSNLELSYGQIDHTKVHYDIYSLIPMGKKYFAWFTYFNDDCVCYIVDSKSFEIYEKVTVIFDETLSLGTIVYGTIITYEKNKFFIIEDLCYYKNKCMNRKKNYEKFNLLNHMVHYEFSMKPYFSSFLTFGMPVMKSNLKDAFEISQQLIYNIYAIQCIKMSDFKKYNKVIYNKNKEPEKINVILKIVPHIQNDIYELFGYTNGKMISVGYAGVPTYEKSVMLNKLFRNIKENNNLDMLEESDDEEEFENICDDKFVDLKKTYNMECTYDYNNKKWVPNKIVKTNKLSNMKDVMNHLQKNQRIKKIFRSTYFPIKPEKVDDHVEKIILDADILASLMFGLNVGVEFAGRLKHELRFEGASKQLFSGFLKFLDNKSLYLDSSKKSC